MDTSATNGEGDNAFHIACSNGHVDVVKFLLSIHEKKKIRIHALNGKGDNAFNQACSNGHVEVVKVLIEQSEFNDIKLNIINKKGENAFHQACSNAQTEIVRLLLKQSKAKKIDLNSTNFQGESAFDLACSEGHIDVIRILLDNSDLMSIDLKSTMGFHKACSSGQAGVVRALLKVYDSNVINIRDKKGDHALHLAVSHGHSEIVAILIKESASKRVQINPKNKNQETPFHLACKMWNREIVIQFLKTRPRKNKDKTADFFLACFHGSTLNWMNSLLDEARGSIDFNVTDMDGKTVMDYGNQLVLNVLSNHVSMKKIEGSSTKLLFYPMHITLLIVQISRE